MNASSINRHVFLLTIVALLSVLACFAPNLSADSKQKKTGFKLGKEDQTKQDLMQLERDIGKANIDRDYAFFDQVEADEFIFTGADGSVLNKQEDLKGLKEPPNPDVTLLAYDVDQMNVLLFEKTAVVTGCVTTKRRIKGTESSSQSRFTDIFVWRDGRWQMVAGHSSRLPKPKQ
jgi:hypothetical protein